MNRSQNALSMRTLLLALHKRAVTAARLDATAAYGSVASRKRHLAWKAEEAKFADSLEHALSHGQEQHAPPSHAVLGDLLDAAPATQAHDQNGKSLPQVDPAAAGRVRAGWARVPLD